MRCILDNAETVSDRKTTNSFLHGWLAGKVHRYQHLRQTGSGFCDFESAFEVGNTDVPRHGVDVDKIHGSTAVQGAIG